MKIKSLNGKYIFVFLLILLQNVFAENNKIFIVMNKSISKGLGIINKNYYKYISEVIVNEKTANINNYINLLYEGINNITIKFNTSLYSCRSMFSDLDNIIYIYASDLYSKNVSDMSFMFSNCSSLNHLDIYEFDTSSVIHMTHMFYNCISLQDLYLNSFNTSSVKDMDYMFYNCYSLEKINLDNFNVESVSSFDYMFYNCHSLLSLNLTNFNINSNNYGEMFTNCNPNLIYCIDHTKTYNFIDLLKNYEENCFVVCNLKYYNYIIQKDLCVAACYEDDQYKYTYDYICYENCPNGTKLLDSNYYCHDEYFTFSTQVINSDTTDNTETTHVSDTTHDSHTEHPTHVSDTEHPTHVSNTTIVSDTTHVLDTEHPTHDSDTEHPTHASDTTHVSDDSDNIPIIKTESGKKNSIGLIIGITAGCVLLIITIIITIIIVKKCKKKNFGEAQTNEFIIKTDQTTADLNREFYNKSNIGNKVIINSGIVVAIFEKDSAAPIKIDISNEKTLGNLIDMYYKKANINNANNLIFLYDGDKLNMEKDKIIKDYIQKDSKDNSLKIEVYDSKTPIKKISFIDNITKNIEIYISPEKTMGDLFIIYHKKRNDAKKKTFLGNGGKIDFENQKNMIIKDYIKNDSEMSIIVVDMSPS